MLQRWRVDDGHKVSEPVRTETGNIYVLALSPDRRWLAFGFDRGALCVVWDAQTRQKVLDIYSHTRHVMSVDVSPASTKFATGAYDRLAFIWSLATGDRLLGPLRHSAEVTAVRFSPDGDRLATATTQFITIYNSDNGHLVLVIPCSFHRHSATPLVWSADGCQLFTASNGEVKRFGTSSGALLSKWSTIGGPGVTSIVLSSNSRFAVVIAQWALSFWDHYREANWYCY